MSDKPFTFGDLRKELDRRCSYVPLTEEQRIKIQKQQKQHKKDYEEWLFFSPGKSDVG